MSTLELDVASDEPNNAALQVEEEAEEEGGWDDDDFDLSDELSPPPEPAPATTSRRAAPASSRAPSPSDFSSDIAGLNDPDIVHLGATPMVGGEGSGIGGIQDIFSGGSPTALGRATSPKLYSQAAQFPTCTQIRVWKWENGVPTSLGVIDATATEEDFVAMFRSAMPRKGEGKAQFKLRPIDIRGHELGQEVTLPISEHHNTIRMLREAEEAERQGHTSNFPFFPGQRGAPAADTQSEFAGEMTRMVEHMLATADARTRQLEEALESERERMRGEELERTRERVDLATNAAQGVQSITERLMKDESQRSERAMQMQDNQSNMLVTTLSTVFAQQQQSTQQASADQRRADEFRLQQERERAQQERQVHTDRVAHEREEADRKRQVEREEGDRKRQTERGEMEERLRREREEGERRWTMEQARMDRDREERRMEMERAKDEARLRSENDRSDTAARLQQDRERLERERMDHEKRLQADKLDQDRKIQQEREDHDRRARQESERMERDRDERRLLLERERQDRDAKMQREMEDAKLRDQERQRQHDRLVEETRTSAQTAREHAERMLQLQKLELEKKTNQGGFEMLTSAAGLLSQFGVDIKDVIPRLLGPSGKDSDDEDEEGGGAWTETIPKVLGVVADMMRGGRGDPAQQEAAQQQAAQRNAARAAAQVARPTEGPRQPLALTAPNAPTPDYMAQLDRQRQEAAQQYVQSQYAASQSPPPVQTMPVSEAPPPQETPEDAPVDVPDSVPETASPAVEAPAEVAQVTPLSQTTLGTGDPARDAKDRARSAGMDLKGIRASRKALKKLVAGVSKASPDRWEEIITAGLLQEPRVYDYIQAITAFAAFTEAGASSDLRAQVITTLRASSLVPDSLNYGVSP
jgi:hypothetical protein